MQPSNPGAAAAGAALACLSTRQPAYDFCRVDSRVAPPQAAPPPAMQVRATSACTATAAGGRRGGGRQGGMVSAQPATQYAPCLPACWRTGCAWGHATAEQPRLTQGARVVREEVHSGGAGRQQRNGQCVPGKAGGIMGAGLMSCKYSTRSRPCQAGARACRPGMVLPSPWPLRVPPVPPS